MRQQAQAEAVSRWRVGAVAQKDPTQVWTQAEVQERVWALEGRADRQQALSVVTLAAAIVGGLTLLGLTALVWRRT